MPGFLLSLAVTLVILGGVVYTGKRAMRPRHLVLVARTVASLVVTIVFAERLGEHYDLESAGRLYPFHLAVAKTAVALYLLPIASGIATIRNARYRKLHGRLAYLSILFTVGTAISGTAMLLAAEPLPALPPD